MKKLTDSDIGLLGETIVWGRFLGTFDILRRESPEMSLQQFWKRFTDIYPYKTDGYVGNAAANIAYLFMIISIVRETDFFSGKPEIEGIDLKQDIQVLSFPVNESLTIAYLVRRVRNSIAHGRFTWEEDGVIFSDSKSSNDCIDFQIRIKHYELYKLAEALLLAVDNSLPHVSVKNG